jgi:hypothetical protein
MKTNLKQSIIFVLTTYVLVVLNTVLLAQAPDIQWTKTFGGNSSE